MSRASAINVPFSILGCFETDLQGLDKLRYPTFIGSSVISSHSPRSSVNLDLGLVITLRLWPRVGSRLLDFPWKMFSSSRSLSSLSFFSWRRILSCLGSFWNPFIRASNSMLPCIAGGRGVSLPVTIITEAEGCGAVISGFVEKILYEHHYRLLRVQEALPHRHGWSRSLRMPLLHLL